MGTPGNAENVFSQEVMTSSLGPQPNNEIKSKGNIESAGEEHGCTQDEAQDQQGSQPNNRYAARRNSIGVPRNNLQRSQIPRKKSPSAESGKENKIGKCSDRRRSSAGDYRDLDVGQYSQMDHHQQQYYASTSHLQMTEQAKEYHLQ